MSKTPPKRKEDKALAKIDRHDNIIIWQKLKYAIGISFLPEFRI